MYVKSLTAGCCLLALAACQKEDETQSIDRPRTIDPIVYNINATNDSGIRGYVVFSRSLNNDNEVNADVALGTSNENTHPVEIHLNSAAESGALAVSLSPVNGRNIVRTTFSTTENGNSIAYKDISDFDGHIVVRKSATDPTIIAEGDIGGNTLTDALVTYSLNGKGNVLMQKRKNGTTKVTVDLDSIMTEAGELPAHIRLHSAVEGGDIAIDLNKVKGATGMSVTTIRKMNDGTAMTYDKLLDFDGYVQIDLPTTSKQADIGGSALNGTSMTYPLQAAGPNGAAGTITFAERKNKQLLVSVDLENTKEGMYPVELYSKSVAEKGASLMALNQVNGATGMSHTNVATMDGKAAKYSDMINYDGHINIYGADAALMSQGDIGGNSLTGQSVEYVLEAMTDGISGKAVFHQRKNGLTLVDITLDKKNAGMVYPAYIYTNTAAEKGTAAIMLNDIEDGISQTTIRQFMKGGAVSYEQLLTYNGSVMVARSAQQSADGLSHGDIGSNKLTGNSKEFAIVAEGNSGVKGKAILAERANGTTLVTLQLEGTKAIDTYAADIYFSTGEVAISLNEVSGFTGIGKTQVARLDNTLAISYDKLIAHKGSIKISKGLGLTPVASGKMNME